MTDQDREKMIAEIWLEEIPKPDPVSSIRQYAKQFEGTLIGEAFKDLFDVIDREREENRKLREDLEGKPWREFLKQVELEEKLQSAQQEIERLRILARQERETADHWMSKHHDDVVTLRNERDKLIEGLRMATDLLGTVPMNDTRLWGVYNKLCDILEENEKELSK